MGKQIKHSYCFGIMLLDSYSKSEITVCDYSIEVLFKSRLSKNRNTCVCSSISLKRVSFGTFGRITKSDVHFRSPIVLVQLHNLQ